MGHVWSSHLCHNEVTVLTKDFVNNERSYFKQRHFKDVNQRSVFSEMYQRQDIKAKDPQRCVSNANEAQRCDANAKDAKDVPALFLMIPLYRDWLVCVTRSHWPFWLPVDASDDVTSLFSRAPLVSDFILFFSVV
jgi:hypothetical protein